VRLLRKLGTQVIKREREHENCATGPNPRKIETYLDDDEK